MGKADRTKQFILEKAAPIFNSKGIAGTTMDDILAATKMAKGGIYRNYESKEAISYASVDYLLKKLTGKVNEIMTKEKTAVKKLFAFMELYSNPHLPYIEGGCPIMNIGVDSDNTNPHIKEMVKKLINSSLEQFAAALKQGIKNGELSSNLNADEYCLKMFVMIEGAMLVSRITDSNKPMHSIIKMLKSELKIFQLN